MADSVSSANPADYYSHERISQFQKVIDLSGLRSGSWVSKLSLKSVKKVATLKEH